MNAATAASARTQQMLQGPLLPTLLRLATPNIIGLVATTVVIGYDGYIVGRVGADALAGVALVFPLSMLMLQMSAGGIGGAVSAAVARALGAGHIDDAGRLARQAVLLALVLAALFALLLLGAGHRVYAAMGGQGAALDAARAYSAPLFAGGVAIWLANVLAAVHRGSGNMVLPSLALMGAALVHLLLAPLLVFGAGAWAGLGVAGAALSTVLSHALAALLLARPLLRPGGVLTFDARHWRPSGERLWRILKVGLPASLSPVISNLAMAVATALVARFGTVALAGFGVAARLEYILVPIAFGFGAALTTLVATNLGAGQTPRALRVAWLGAAVVALLTGTIGLATALWPALWMAWFAADVEVFAMGARYLQIVGGSYGLFGFGLALFFASQGAGRMLWPLLGSAARLAVMAVGGWLWVVHWQGGLDGLFAVVGLSFVLYAGLIAAAIRLGGWAGR